MRNTLKYILNLIRFAVVVNVCVQMRSMYYRVWILATVGVVEYARAMP